MPKLSSTNLFAVAETRPGFAGFAVAETRPGFAGFAIALALAAIAPLSGCGGKVGEEGPGVDGGLDGAVDAASDGAVDGTSDGGPTACGYGPCSEGYSCSDGCNTCWCTGTAWACTTKDCPDVGPPDEGIDVGPAGCPVSEPPSGAPCNGMLACDYLTACGAKDTAYCGGDGSHWKIAYGKCAPPPVCPAYEPAPGTACPAPLKCAYMNSCGGTDVAYCTAPGATWNVSGTCTTPAPCPATEPKPGTACTGLASCTYTNACGGTDYASCASASSTWSVGIGACTTACPATEPKPGTSCPVVGKSCSWGNGCGGIDYGYCSSTGWQLKGPSPCVPGCPATKPTSGTMCGMPSSTMCQYMVSADCQTGCFCADDSHWACLPASCSGGGAPPPTP